jgi:hypothetical protein
LTDLNFTYTVFGLTLRSNQQIPNLPLAKQPDGVRAVDIHLNVSPLGNPIVPFDPEVLTYISAYKDEAGNAALKIWNIAGGKYCRLEYLDGTQFWLNREGTEAWATWPAQSTIEDAATYLLGPVLGRILRLRGVMCLHASAVAFGDRATAFVGAEGAGKSTTAAALALRGHPILSDDVVALAEHDGSFFVEPAYPYLCLWPEAVQSICGSPEALPRFSSNYEKRFLSLERQELRFEERCLPLATIYVLAKRRRNAVPLIEEIAPREAFFSLLANTFGSNVVENHMRAKEFETLGRLVSSVRIRRIWAHEDAKRLPELCQRICADLEGMNSQKSPSVG